MKTRTIARLVNRCVKHGETLVTALRKAQQASCGPSPVERLSEQQAFALLQEALTLRDKLRRFASSFDDLPQ
jgi:hypothetical protein